MIEIDGKQFELQEAFVIPNSEANTSWDDGWGNDYTYEVDLAREEMEVRKCFVLVPVEEKSK